MIGLVSSSPVAGPEATLKSDEDTEAMSLQASQFEVGKNELKNKGRFKGVLISLTLFLFFNNRGY